MDGICDWRQVAEDTHTDTEAKISFAPQVSGFHHCGSELESINTHDYCWVVDQEIGIAPFHIKDKSMKLMGFLWSVERGEDM